MKYVLSLADINNLEFAKFIPVEEILLQTVSFSKVGMIEDRCLSDCLAQLIGTGKKVVLAWDFLLKDKDIEYLGKRLDDLADNISAVRFTDPGAGLFLKENFPRLDLQFSMEHCNANLSGVLEWIEIFHPSLRRLIFSNQIPIANIGEFQTEISNLNKKRGVADLEIESLVLGRLQIFYSARRLLSPHISYDQERDLDLAVSSRQNGEGLVCQALDNEKGTIIFHHKDLCVLDRKKELDESGARVLRFEFYHSDHYELLARYFLTPGWEGKIKKKWPRELDHGFFYENPTYRSLRQITNQILQKEKESQVGTVTEAVKKSRVLVEIHKELKLPATVEFISPEGKKNDYQLKTAIDLQGRKFSNVLPPGYYVLPWIKSSVPATIIKLKS